MVEPLKLPAVFVTESTLLIYDNNIKKYDLIRKKN